MSAAPDTSKSQRTDNYHTTMDQNQNQTHNHNHNHHSTGRPSRNQDFRGTPNNQSRNSSGNPAIPGSNNNNADRFNHRNANRPQKEHNAETDGPLTQLDVYSPSGDTLFVIPVSDIIHLPPDFSARTKGHNQHNNRKLTLCPRYMVHSYTSEHLSEKEELLRAQQQQDKDSNKDTSSSLSEIECPNGDACHHVHASLKRASVNNDIHINYAYKALEHVKYERFPEFEENGTTPKVLRVAPPNETHPFIEIPAQYCLKTKAFTGNRRITSHCAHYYYNRICNRGSECFFIHAISFEVDKEIQEEQELLHEKKKVLSQKLQEELEKNRAARGASRGSENVATPSVTKEDANIYLADCEDGYILRAWGRTQPFRDYDPNADHSRSRKKRKHRRRGRGGGGSDRSGSDSSRTSSVSSTNTARSDPGYHSNGNVNNQNGLFGQTTQQPPAQQQLFGSATMNTSGSMNNNNNKNPFAACINNNNTPHAPIIGDDQQQHSQSRHQQQPTTPNSRGKMSSLAAAFTNTPKQNEEEIREQRSLSRRESARQTPVHHSHNEGFTVPPPMSLQNQQQQPGGGMFGAALVHNNSNNMEMNSPNRNNGNNNNTSSGQQSFHNTPKFGPQSSPSAAPNAIQQGGPFGAAMPTNYSNDGTNNMMTSPTGNNIDGGPVVPPPNPQAGYTGQRGVSSTNSGRESPNVACNTTSGQTTPNRRGNNPYALNK